jgi:hypothetical protein
LSNTSLASRGLCFALFTFRSFGSLFSLLLSLGGGLGGTLILILVGRFVGLCGVTTTTLGFDTSFHGGRLTKLLAEFGLKFSLQNNDKRK